MHFHLPKPLHGWRELLGEVGIIVIGVLIALGAEQVVDDIRWHQKVAVVRNSLMEELGNDRGRWQADMAEVPCLLDNIGKLDRWARSGGSDNVTAASGELSNGGFFWMHSANWQLATASQTLDHFPPMTGSRIARSTSRRRRTCSRTSAASSRWRTLYRGAATFVQRSAG